MNRLENIEEKYKLLIFNYLLNHANNEEKSDLLTWLEMSEENKNLFEEIRKIFDLSLGANLRGKFSSVKSLSWRQLNEKIELSGSDRNSQKTRNLSFYFKVAAVAILVFSIGAITSLLVFNNNPNQKLSNIEHEIIVPRGGKSEIILPDGTKVWLNAGTRFRYRGDYGIDNRNVYLEGEGYFSVIKNPAKPFIVQTSNLKIKAFGTSFNVKAYPEEAFVTTTLVEGILKIEGKGIDLSLKPKEVVKLEKEISQLVLSDDKEEVLTPQNKKVEEEEEKDEESFIQNKDIQVQSDVNTNIYTAWKDNLWILESESLKNIAIVLERKFNVTINIESSELDKYTFTGTFNKETLEQILNVIKLTAPLDYQISKGVVVIKEEQKRKSLYNNFK
jgi:transmembrane sensor